MTALRIVICDDDADFRAILRRAAERALARLGCPCAVTEAGGAEALLTAGDFDLLLLDIDMPGMDGIRLGERLRARGCRADIIYISNMEDKVYEIFHVHPWSFIRKSRFDEELPAVLAEYVRARAPREELILPGAEGGVVPVDPAALIYVEAAGKTQKLVRPDGQTLVRASMRELEAALLPHGFIRIHKGFLVNYRFVRKITSRSVLLDGGGDLPIGRDRLAAARERYLSLMKWKGLQI